MIVSFIPDKEKDRLYTPLKEFCLSCKNFTQSDSLDVGISHQNVLLKFIRNKNSGSVASKIAQ